MIKESLQLLSDYGWVALFLFVIGGVLIRYITKMLPIWRERDDERTERHEITLQEELLVHQFFSNITFKINSEIHTLDFNGKQTPVRQKLFRKLIELRLTSIHDLAKIIIRKDMRAFTPSSWASFIIFELSQTDSYFEDAALKEGIPAIVVKKFLVSQHKSNEILSSYVNDLAVSTVYNTNLARTNTLLYLMNLNLITTVGDAERTLVALNGELSGLQFGDSIIEDA